MKLCAQSSKTGQSLPLPVIYLWLEPVLFKWPGEPFKGVKMPHFSIVGAQAGEVSALNQRLH